MVEHVNISDPHIHEPKGASTAPENTVLVSNGNGTTTWKDIRSDLASYGTLFAEEVVIEETGKVIFTNIGETKNMIGNLAGSHLEISGSGVYQISFSGQIVSPTNDSKILVVRMDDFNTHIKTESKVHNDPVTVTNTGIFALNSGSRITLGFYGTEATLSNINLTIIRVG